MNTIYKLLLLMSVTICYVSSMEPNGLQGEDGVQDDAEDPLAIVQLPAERRNLPEHPDVPPRRRPRLDPPDNGESPDRNIDDLMDSEDDLNWVDAALIPMPDDIGQILAMLPRGRPRRRNRGLGRNGLAIIDSPDDVSTESSNNSPPGNLDEYLNELPPVGNNVHPPTSSSSSSSSSESTMHMVYIDAYSNTSHLVPLSANSSASTSTSNNPRNDEGGNSSTPLLTGRNSTTESSLTEYEESSPETTTSPGTQSTPLEEEKPKESDLEAPMSNWTRIKKTTDLQLNRSSNHSPFHFDSKTTSKIQPRNDYDTCEISSDIFQELEDYKINIDLPVWHHYTFETGSYNREELQIVEVVAEKSFTLDRQIIEWVGLNHQAVGRGNHGLSLITTHADGNRINNIELDDSISSLSMFQWWNRDVKALCTGLLTAQSTMIKWHWMNDDNTLKLLWTWPLTFNIIYMEIFKFDDNWKVAITHEQNGVYNRAVSIYGLDLWENWWFEQKIRGYGKPVIINNGRLLAIQLEDAATVAIYKYDYITRKYIEFKNITSPEVEDLKYFVVGSSSFLAIGGENPVIYEIRGTEFIEKKVEHYNLNHVEQYLPIPIGYYRNDAIILFQHKLDHYTHSSSILEALQWNGDTFVLLEHSPCKSHDEEMFGFSCILDAEGEKGIKGAAIIKSNKDGVNILTASEEYTPIMFEIKTELVEIPNPLNAEVEELLHVKDNIEKGFEHQYRVFEQAEKIIYSNRDLNEDVFTADNWKIKEIHAPSVHIEGNIQESLYEDSTINVAGQDWRYLDLNMDTSQLLNQIKVNHDRLKTLMNKLKYAIMKGDGLPETLRKVKILGEIKVNGDIKVKESHIENLNGLNVDSVLKNAVKKGKDGKLIISGDVTVENLKTKNIDVNYVNGLNVKDPEDPPSSNPFIVNGDLEIQNHIHVLKDVDLTENGTINSIDFKKDLYTPDDKENLNDPNCLYFDSINVNDVLIAKRAVNGFNFTEESFNKLIEEKRIRDNENIMKKEALTLEALSVGNQLHFDNINDRSWKIYTESVVMIDDDTAIDDLEVDGVITLDSELSMNFLNGLSYPDDYLLLNENSSIFISASKTFANGLQAVEVDCEGTVNGIAPHNIVTLSTRQNLDNFTFFDLTVTERMNVQGDITGRELDAFLSNPLLKEVNEVKSNVIFRNLRVNGTVSVENKINGTDWDNIFRGVIMKTDNATTIDSFKSFDGHVFVDNGLNIKSGFINNRRLSEFFTLDTDQIVTNNVISGNISFEHLRIDGTFDGINITELNENSVKLSGDQTVMSNLIFDDGDNVDYDGYTDVERSLFQLDVNNMEVTEKCNGLIVPDDIIFHDDHVIELHSPQFDNLYVENLIIDGDLESMYVCGIDLNYFNDVRLSKTEYRDVIAPYTALNCSIDSLDFDFMNGMSKNDIEIINGQMKNIEEEILNGNINIGTLHVNGILNVSNINGVDLRLIAENAIWLKENNDVKTHLIFNDKITVKKLYIHGNAYDMHFNGLISDLVHPYDDYVVLDGNKIYENGLDIQGNITTDYINDIKVSNILTYHEDQVIRGNVYISGSLEINGNLQTENNIMNDISKSLEYNQITDEYYMKGDYVLSNKDIYIDNLIVDGIINNIHSVNDVLNSAASTVKDNYFDNTIVFMKSVKIENDLSVIDTYNGINMNHFTNDLVMMNAETFVNSSVIFNRPLTVEGNLYVHDDLSTDYMQDCDVNEWKSNAIHLNKQQQVISGVKEFKNLTIKGNVIVKNVNGVDFDSFITLNTDQVIDGNFKFNTVYADSDVSVDGFVNGVRLNEEYQNTLMIDGDQTIETPIHFHSNVTVTGNARINKINSADMNNVVTLDSDQTLYSQYNFHGDTVFEKDLNIAGDISGIDFDQWIKNAMFTNEYGNHIVEGNWHIDGDVAFENHLYGTGTIDGLNMDDLNKYLQIRDQTRRFNEDNFRYQYSYLCDGINYFMNVINNKIYKFNYFEEIQSISSIDFLATFHFEHNGSNFMIMSDKWNCKGYLWKWNGTVNQYKKINRIEIGCPIKWHTIQSKKSFYLLSIAGLECECKLSGTSIWSFDGITLQFIKMMVPVESIFVPSNEYGSYYAMKLDTLYKYIIQDQVDKFDVTQTIVSPRIDGKLKLLSAKLDTNDLILANDGKPLKYSDGQFVTIPNERISSVNDMIDLYVGKMNKHLIAAAWPPDPNNNSTDESIIIYEDAFNGVVFQKISCYNPSSLVTIRLDSYETLLLFVENHRTVQVYSYHGFQGFKHLYGLNFRADMLQFINIKDNGGKTYLTIAGDGILSVAEVIMYGQRVDRISICDNSSNA